ncbi:hypothetical protein C8Q80DRAFT_1175344 [Daedaleopsis nitida]|nr:hypothetical protein C8Q80DRAFT_1175344 [Daedaleopsis nitida]
MGTTATSLGSQPSWGKRHICPTPRPQCSLRLPRSLRVFSSPLTNRSDSPSCASLLQGGKPRNHDSNNSGNTASGNQMGQSGQQQQPAGEQKDWLDKGISAAGQEVGVNVSDNNADKAGDFANKEFTNKEGYSLPGVR